MILSDIVRTVVLTVVFFTCINFVYSKPAVKLEESPDKNLNKAQAEAFKQGILNGLEYQNRPDVKKFNISISERREKIREFREYMKKKQDMRFIEENDASHAQSEVQIHRYNFKGEIPENVDRSSWLLGHKLYFRLDEKHPENPHEELLVHSAILKFYKNATLDNQTNRTSNDAEISIHQIYDIHSDGNTEKRLLESKHIDTRNGGWETTDVTNLVQEWIDDEQRNLGIELTSNTHNISSILNSFKKDSSSVLKYISSNSVVLEIKTSVKPILKRVKRRAARRDCKKGDGENRCCRFSVYISFKELGWDDWILAPPGYEAHYCDGSCPHGFKVANTFASIQSILHQKHPSAIPAPCCVPTELSPLTILHFDENGQYKFTDYPDMIIEECRCA